MTQSEPSGGDESPGSELSTTAPFAQQVARAGRWLGPALATLVFLLLQRDANVAYEAAVTAGVAVLMAVWWMTEAVPLAVTALLPLALLPALGVYGEPSRTNNPIRIAAASYAEPSIFLFLGGFFIALAVERWGLHRRFALLTLLSVGTRPAAIVGGFLLATAAISMWISNTATALMMLPIALSIVKLVEERPDPLLEPALARRDAHRFAASLMLAVAYASSIGGCATLVGTPPNIYFRAFAAENGIQLSFGRWLLFAAPVAAVYLLLCWWLLTRWIFPVQFREVAGGEVFLRQQFAALGRISRGEWTVLLVFLGTALAWIAHEPLSAVLPGTAGRWLRRLDDTSIAMIAAVALFLLPIDARRGVFALDWKTAMRAPWDVLLMFGGGLSLSEAIRITKLADYLGSHLALLGELPLPVLLAALSLAIIFFSELTSNVATIATVLPIVYRLAGELDVDPLLLMVPCTLSASYAFMLPAGTPPNAIAYASGRVTMAEMMRGGFWLNVAGGVLIPLATATLGRWVLGIRW
jgi:sodium-dependent dicarboxylate transporter 2/3/5